MAVGAFIRQQEISIGHKAATKDVLPAALAVELTCVLPDQLLTRLNYPNRFTILGADVKMLCCRSFRASCVLPWARSILGYRGFGQSAHQI